MGEIADMMLDGTLCEGCGCYLEGEAQGIPRYCNSCKRGFLFKEPSLKTTCDICGKKVKPTGLADHKKDVHGI